MNLLGMMAISNHVLQMQILLPSCECGMQDGSTFNPLTHNPFIVKQK